MDEQEKALHRELLLDTLDLINEQQEVANDYRLATREDDIPKKVRCRRKLAEFDDLINDNIKMHNKEELL